MSGDEKTKHILLFINNNVNFLHLDFFARQGDSVLPNPQIALDPSKSIEDIFSHLMAIVPYLKEKDIQSVLIECQRTQSTKECGGTMIILGNIFTQIKYGKILEPFKIEITSDTPGVSKNLEDIDDINETRVMMLEDIATMEQIYNEIVKKSKEPAAPAASSASSTPAASSASSTPAASSASSTPAASSASSASSAPLVPPVEKPGLFDRFFGKKGGKRRSKKQKSRKARKQRRTRK
jgi:hypothetical protein